MELMLNGVSFSYGSTRILDSVCLELDRGEVLGIIGPNGSGKTTLMRCINRILTPSQGEILFESSDVMRMNPREIAKVMGYVPQNAVNEFSTPTVYEVVMMGRRPHSLGWQNSDRDDAIVWNSMKEMGVDGLASRMFNRLSSGQTQRVLMARALAQEASILLLDEPTSNLDVRYQLEVMDIVKKLSREKRVGVCAVMHDMNIAMRYCDKILMLDRGEVTAVGKTEEVLTPERIEMTYGVKIAIDHNYGRPQIIIL